MNNFLQTKEYLYSLIPATITKRFPGKLGLLRMEYLLQKLGNPQKQFPSIHIVGTCGKSSTAYLISQIFKQAGFGGQDSLKVGLHISPHLQTMQERLQINGRLISEKKFVSLINSIKPTIEALAKTPWGRSTYFEALLAATFLYFQQQKVDLAVVEAGLGGRFDGTNVLRPKIVILTNIGLDHTEILGKTKTAILRDKMQTIKPGSDCVITGIKEKGLLSLLKKHCLKQRVPLLTYKQDFFVSNQRYAPNYSQFDFIKCAIPGIAQDCLIPGIKLGLPGIFQIENACLAIATALQFARLTNLKICPSHIKNGLKNSFFPGRLETVKNKPLIILDGAHNQDKIRALVKSIKQIYSKRKIIIIFGVKKDKNIKKMLSLLKKISNQFIISQFGSLTDLGCKLNYPARKLFQEAKKILPGVKLHLEMDCPKAIKKAQQLAGKGGQDSNQDIILITGSLYLVGEARKYFKLKPAGLEFSKQICL